MCGICGVLRPGGDSLDSLNATGEAMIASLRHRGPDDSGIWCDAGAGVVLGHRRLAILDLSEAGRQPMHSASGRHVLSYNGEIYNCAELRHELEAAGVAFRGHSDTEVLLAAIDAWGLDATLSKLNGMFAFVVWDTRERTLHLVRDRIGIKPLYYGWHAGTFVFSSELKAMAAVPGVCLVMNRDSLALYFRSGMIPAPHSIYQGIYKLMPGCSLAINSAQPTTISPMPAVECQGTVAPRRYWSVQDVFESRQAESPMGRFEDAVEQFGARLGEAVRVRMLADVPLGAFLSGGVDSSLIVALMQQQAGTAVNTFTIGFDESGYDESPFAAGVSRHLGTNHTAMRVTSADALGVIGDLPMVYDEPFADSSQIPTVLLSRLTRQHVTVALSGDGADELFAGYDRYRHCRRFLSCARVVPRSLRWLPAGMLDLLSNNPVVSAVVARWMGGASRSVRRRVPRDVLRLSAALLRDCHAASVYRRVMSVWPDPETLILEAQEPGVLAYSPAVFDRWREDPIRAMRLSDLLHYHPDDILAKVDRASMAASLEVRVPFLDHRVVGFAATVPPEYLVDQQGGKRIVRALLARYIPRELVERPKTGFGVPIGDWLLGPLRDWAEGLLAESNLTRAGLQPALIRAAWHEHCKGLCDHAHRLWAVLMFQAWWEQTKRL